MSRKYQFQNYRPLTGYDQTIDSVRLADGTWAALGHEVKNSGQEFLVLAVVREDYEGGKTFLAACPSGANPCILMLNPALTTKR